MLVHRAILESKYMRNRGSTPRFVGCMRLRFVRPTRATSARPVVDGLAPAPLPEQPAVDPDLGVGAGAEAGQQALDPHGQYPIIILSR